jgi:hypothetical protein
MVVVIAIAVVLTGAITDSTEVRMAGGSKARCFASYWKVADKADNGATDQSAMLMAICSAKSHARIPKV